MVRTSGAHEPQKSLLQPFWPVQPTKEGAPNLTKLQSANDSQDDAASLSAVETFRGLRGLEEDTDLVASHAILFHLLEFALQLHLPLHFLLSTADEHQLPVHLLPVHVVHCLREQKRCQTLCGEK